MLSGWMFFLCFDPVLTRGCFFRCFFVSVEGPPNRGLFCYFQENTVCLSGGVFFWAKNCYRSGQHSVGLYVNYSCLELIVVDENIFVTFFTQKR